ncbi:hypothetical protein BDR07DRAFT_1399730 [Suillus spraguei]|nr:hypothetical protein BDR07DRAFT_1494258 [Suillus spraguei]KAG2365069.1 hypothetical protein BDR07DRAFT_1399730 [Suillus spraguei]
MCRTSLGSSLPTTCNSMLKPSHMSLHSGLFEDDCFESDTADPEDEYTLTAFGELSLSQEEMFGFAPNDIRRRNRMRLRERDKSGYCQYRPQFLEKFWDEMASPLVSTPTLIEMINEFQRGASQRAQAKTRSRATDSGKSTSSNLSASYDDELKQSVIVDQGMKKTTPEACNFVLGCR